MHTDSSVIICIYHTNNTLYIFFQVKVLSGELKKAKTAEQKAKSNEQKLKTTEQKNKSVLSTLVTVKAEKAAIQRTTKKLQKQYDHAIDDIGRYNEETVRYKLNIEQLTDKVMHI